MKKIGLIGLLILITFSGMAQSELAWDSTFTMNRKNIVRWNVSAFTLFGTENIILGYERVLAPHQSVSVNIGQLKFPQLLNLDLAQYNIQSERKSSGYSLAVDYRRYLRKRNRSFAPDGLYWGPYLVYYHWETSLGLSHTEPTTNIKSDVTLNGEVNIAQVGLELGYQFILAKRLAIDLILLGPGGGLFNAQFGIDGSLDIDEQSELYQAYYQKIVDQIPGFEKLIEDKELSTGGSYTSGSGGMRYVIQIGFLF